MPAITLDILTNTSAGRAATDTYRDLKLDLQLNQLRNNQLFKDKQITDIDVEGNLGAIFNSITNIIITRPGQKPLAPPFGIGIENLLFQPVSDSRAALIGDEIYQGIVKFEPRVKVDLVEIEPREEEQEYIITIKLTVPKLKTTTQLRGVLDRTGFFLNR